MAAQYLDLTNRVLENIRQEPIVASEFAAPGDPAPAIKRFLNEAKDDVLMRIGGGLFERDLLFETRPSVTYANVGNLAITTGLGSGTTNLAAGSVFDSGMVGAKLMMPDIAYAQSAPQPVVALGAKDATWRRIVTAPTPDTCTLDAPFTRVLTNSTAWTIFFDEFDLDPTVRQVLDAWTNAGPLGLVFVDQVKDLDDIFPGQVTFGTPQFLAIVRSPTGAGNIWRARLYPASADREVIRYRARTRLADLVNATDFWSIEPELENIIVDAAMVKALQSPIHNDPDLALVNDRAIGRRTDQWRRENQPSDAGRRFRRSGPDEMPDWRKTRIARVRFTTS